MKTAQTAESGIPRENGAPVAGQRPCFPHSGVFQKIHLPPVFLRSPPFSRVPPPPAPAKTQNARFPFKWKTAARRLPTAKHIRLPMDAAVLVAVKAWISWFICKTFVHQPNMTRRFLTLRLFGRLRGPDSHLRYSDDFVGTIVWNVCTRRVVQLLFILCAYRHNMCLDYRHSRLFRALFCVVLAGWLACVCGGGGGARVCGLSLAFAEHSVGWTRARWMIHSHSTDGVCRYQTPSGVLLKIRGQGTVHFAGSVRSPREAKPATAQMVCLLGRAVLMGSTWMGQVHP